MRKLCENLNEIHKATNNLLFNPDNGNYNISYDPSVLIQLLGELGQEIDEFKYSKKNELRKLYRLLKSDIFDRIFEFHDYGNVCLRKQRLITCKKPKAYTRYLWDLKSLLEIFLESNNMIKYGSHI